MSIKVHVLEGGVIEARTGPHSVRIAPDAGPEVFEAAAHLLVEKAAGFRSADVILAVSTKLFGAPN